LLEQRPGRDGVAAAEEDGGGGEREGCGCGDAAGDGRGGQGFRVGDLRRMMVSGTEQKTEQDQMASMPGTRPTYWNSPLSSRKASMSGHGAESGSEGEEMEGMAWRLKR